MTGKSDRRRTPLAKPRDMQWLSIMYLQRAPEFEGSRCTASGCRSTDASIPAVCGELKDSRRAAVSTVSCFGLSIKIACSSVDYFSDF